MSKTNLEPGKAACCIDCPAGLTCVAGRKPRIVFWCRHCWNLVAHFTPDGALGTTEMDIGYKKPEQFGSGIACPLFKYTPDMCRTCSLKQREKDWNWRARQLYGVFHEGEESEENAV